MAKVVYVVNSRIFSDKNDVRIKFAFFVFVNSVNN